LRAKYERLKIEREELYVALGERSIQVAHLKQQLGIVETEDSDSSGMVGGGQSSDS